MEKGLCSETSKGTKVLEKSKWFRVVFGLKALRRPTSIGNGIRAPGRRGFQTISAESAPLPCAGVHVRQNRPSEPPRRRVHYGPQREPTDRLRVLARTFARRHPIVQARLSPCSFAPTPAPWRQRADLRRHRGRDPRLERVDAAARAAARGPRR